MSSKREDLEIVIGADLNGLASDLARGARMVKGLARDVERGTPKPRDFAPRVDPSGFKGASKGAKDAGFSVREFAGELAGFGAKAAVTGGTLIALEMGFEGVGGALKHVKESVSMAAQLEQTTLAFDVMLGSAQKAEEMVSGMRKFAAETPFNSRDVTEAGKQLLAYGVAADQVIPTMRMLGDVSAAFGKDLPLKDLTYLYGTLFAQQRAYAVDIRQFAGRGIPIYEELAKTTGKSVDEMKSLVEEGRVGRDEVTSAFMSMTGEGGRFFKMTERQSGTVLGIWEQMSDAFDLVKIKLGQVIIEEAGLKGVGRDLESFAKRIELNVNTGGVRDAIRFVSNLGKGIAQLASEGTRASGALLKIFGGQFDAMFPGVGRTVREVQSLMESLQNVKFDTSKVTDFGIAFGEQIAAAFEIAAGFVLKIGKNVLKFVIAPLLMAVAEMKPVLEMAKGAAEGVVGANARAGRAAVSVVDFVVNPPLFGKTVREAKDNPARDAGVNAALAGASSDKDWIKAQLEAMDNLTGALKPNTDALKDFRRSINDQRREARYQEMLKIQTQIDPERTQDKLVSALNLVKANRDGAIAIRQFLNPLDPMAGLVSGAITGRREQERANAMSGMGGPLGLFLPSGTLPKDPNAGGVKLMGDMRAGAHDVFKGLTEKYDPLAPGGKLMEHKADLDDLLKRGKITPELHELGWRDALKDVADRLGAGQATKLTDATLVGSQEDARLLAHHFSDEQKQTTEDLLAQIRDILNAIRGTTGKMADEPAPKPINIGPNG